MTIMLDLLERNHRRSLPFGPLRRLKAALMACAVPLALGVGCKAEPPVTPAEHEPAEIVRFEGDVQLKNGDALRYSVILAPDPSAAGEYLGTIDIPAQALSGATLEHVRFTPRQHVAFELSRPGTPSWAGHFNADGTLTCRFEQGDASLPCTMREVGARPPSSAAPRHRAQTPEPPFPYISEDVRYASPAHVMLAGTVSVPPGPGPHPAVLLVSDVGPHDRDAAHFGHAPFLVLADHLARAGIAVLRVDDRGVGGSDAGPPNAGSADLVTDIAAGLDHLKARRDIDAGRLGVIGHGFGAWLATLAARERADVRYLVLLAPPARDGQSSLARQREREALERGASASDAAATASHARAVSALLMAEADPARWAAAYAERFALSPREDGAEPQLPHEDAELLDRALVPGFRDYLREDPVPAFERIDRPVLVLGAERDGELDTAEHWPRLTAAFTRTPQATLTLLPGLNHWFQAAETGDPSEYERSAETFAPAALEEVARYVRDRTAR